MASKKDLEGRIEALEAEIAQLRLQVAQKQQGITIPPPYVYRDDWYRPTVVWCGANTSPAVRGTISLS